jgi:methylaspartate mutase epsilon subunit
LGFDRVFVNFTDVRTVLDVLKKDFEDVDPVPDYPALWNFEAGRHRVGGQILDDSMLTLEAFDTMRKEVLAQWATGQEARGLRDNADYLSRVPQYAVLQNAVNKGLRRTLVQPRCGVASVREQIHLFNVYKSVGAGTLSYQVDSLTRNNNYKAAAEAIRDSQASGISTINGFPVVNHGVPALRKVMEETRMPLQTRHSTRRPELLAEISYAGGVSAFEGGPICYNIPYYKDYPLDESISRWQYVDRLTGIYYERYGVALDREFFGVLTATLVPPCIAITTNILEAILAAGQGVKCISVGYAEQGNRWQDIAAIRVMRQKTVEALQNLGHKDVQINTVFHQYMAAFPTDLNRAEQLLIQSAATSAMSCATRILIKTPVEAFRIPTVHDNSYAIQLVHQGLQLGLSTVINEAKVEEECSILRREVDQLLEGVIMCGQGQVSKGIVRAFQTGVLEIPFAPSIYNRGEVITARDNEGAVRFLHTGRLPFDRELRDRHKSFMSGRRSSEGIGSELDDYLLVEKDVMRLPRGDYQSWPLSA